MRIALVLAFFLLAACAPQPRYEVVDRQAQERAYVQALAERCSQFGYERPGEAHSGCMERLHQQVLANRAAGQAALMQGVVAEHLRLEAERCRSRAAAVRGVPGYGAYAAGRC